MYKEKVEVTFRVVVDENGDGQAYLPKSSMKKKDLFKSKKKHQGNEQNAG